MSIFCTHEWVARSGMDSGSICEKCGKITAKETAENSNSGLSSGVLKKKNELLRKLFKRNEKAAYKNR